MKTSLLLVHTLRMVRVPQQLLLWSHHIAPWWPKLKQQQVTMATMFHLYKRRAFSE